MVCPSAEEYAEWDNNAAGGTTAAREWAGYEMVACTETGEFARPGNPPVPKVVRRCNGENDCIAEGGACRIENGVAICSSDETGCGGLVDQVVGGTVIAQPDYDDPNAPDTPIQLAMGSSIELMVGPSLESNWIVPYGEQYRGDPTWYSYATCVTYGEIADTEVRIATQWAFATACCSGRSESETCWARCTFLVRQASRTR
jgi:hypothetical protein